MLHGGDGLDLGSGRIVASEIAAPSAFVNLVWSGWASVQRDDATGPRFDLGGVTFSV